MGISRGSARAWRPGSTQGGEISPWPPEPGTAAGGSRPGCDSSTPGPVAHAPPGPCRGGSDAGQEEAYCRTRRDLAELDAAVRRGRLD